MSDIDTARRAFSPGGPAREPVAGTRPDEPLSSAPRAGKGWAARGLTAVIRAYQLARTGRVSPCRFTPTCSQYAVEAVERHGAGRGLALTARRLGRCRPGGPSGYDPVPE